MSTTNYDPEAVAHLLKLAKQLPTHARHRDKRRFDRALEKLDLAVRAVENGTKPQTDDDTT